MEKQIEFKNGKINYSLNGNGDTVVLLHGFLEDISIWSNFSKLLSKNYKVIAIDLPGFGKSSVFNKIHQLHFMADAVNAVLENEQVKSCIMTGHSMGGYVTLAFAALYADKLKGLVLFHSQAAADNEEAKTNRDRTIDIVTGNHASFIHAFVPSLFAEANVEKYNAEIKILEAVSLNTSTDGITAALAGMRDRQDSTKLLSELDCPVFFIIGKKDSKIDLNTVVDQLTLPKNCEALLLENVGHMGFIEAENITYLALEHFIERNI